MTAIETSGLTKTYGDLVAVDDLDLSVEVTAGPYYLVYGEGPPVEAETWYLVVEQFNPIFAYTNLISQIVEGSVFQFQYGHQSVEASGMTPAERYPGDAPFYLQDEFDVVLLCWLAVPVAIGYYRFKMADL